MVIFQNKVATNGKKEGQIKKNYVIELHKLSNYVNTIYVNE